MCNYVKCSVIWFGGERQNTRQLDLVTNKTDPCGMPEVLSAPVRNPLACRKAEENLFPLPTDVMKSVMSP